MKNENREIYVGTTKFIDYFATGDVSHLISGHKEFFSKLDRGFISRLRIAGGNKKLGNEFEGIEYEMKLNAICEPKYRNSDLHTPSVIDSVRRTFNGMRKYLADGVMVGSTVDAHYFGAEKESFLIEEGHPMRVKVKRDLEFLSNDRQNALVTKRSEKQHNVGGFPNAVNIIVGAMSSGATYSGRLTKNKSDVEVLDTRSGRLYNITASACTANNHRLFQVEVEYHGYILPFEGSRNVYGGVESEREIVTGIVDIGMHVRRRIAYDKKMSFVLEPTELTKYDFVSKVQGKRSLKEQESALMQVGLDDLVKNE